MDKLNHINGWNERHKKMKTLIPGITVSLCHPFWEIQTLTPVNELWLHLWLPLFHFFFVVFILNSLRRKNKLVILNTYIWYIELSLELLLLLQQYFSLLIQFVLSKSCLILSMRVYNFRHTLFTILISRDFKMWTEQKWYVAEFQFPNNISCCPIGYRRSDTKSK